MSTTETGSTVASQAGEEPTRRDMIHVAAAGVGAVGAAMAVWPFIDQMNPAADTLALASVEVDVSSLEEGSAILLKWRGKPVFIRRRTDDEVAEMQAVPMSALADKQTDAERVLEGKEQFLVVMGVCTHLGCVPLGTKSGEEQGDYDGWFCPCHGSHYDKSGRIRKGPAPRNLEVPQYAFLDDTTIRIG